MSFHLSKIFCSIYRERVPFERESKNINNFEDSSVFFFWAKSFCLIIYLYLSKGKDKTIYSLARMNYKDEKPKLELKLNLSPPRDQLGPHWANELGSSAEISPRSSCVSREVGPDDEGYSSSPESMMNMILVGCPRCLMYVMLIHEDDPKCPKCKSNVLLDFMHEDKNNNGLKK